MKWKNEMNPFKKPFKLNANEQKNERSYINIFFVFSFFCGCQIFVSFWIDKGCVCVCLLSLWASTTKPSHCYFCCSVFTLSAFCSIFWLCATIMTFLWLLLCLQSLPYLLCIHRAHPNEVVSKNGKTHEPFEMKNKTLSHFEHTQFMTWVVFVRHAATGGSTKQSWFTFSFSNFCRWVAAFLFVIHIFRHHMLFY